jgi:hypothetical protein
MSTMEINKDSFSEEEADVNHVVRFDGTWNFGLKLFYKSIQIERAERILSTPHIFDKFSVNPATA